MSLTNGIGEIPHPSDAGALGATVGTHGVARAGAASRNSSAVSGAAAELAMDPAGVSLAGAMISEAKRGSDVRFDKVAALRQAIAAGSYQVSSASLADKLIGVLLK